ncbi:MAG: hypothetical protein HY719_13255 [Planctomycetes bacterium]|nr:hypothetical protein [Planctomycetota bacterium]
MGIHVEVDETLLRRAESATGIGDPGELVRRGLEHLAGDGSGLSPSARAGAPVKPQLLAVWETVSRLPPLSDSEAAEIEKVIHDAVREAPPWSV